MGAQGLNSLSVLSILHAVLSPSPASWASSTMSSSALYTELQDLMVENHDTLTSYGDTRYLYCFTDCQKGDSSTITCFYSGTELDSSWDGGTTWNREHCWPKSKNKDGESSNGNADIIMLRPTSSSINSGRGNTAYGQSSGYYNPNGKANGQYDLRGDVARIIMFGYVRWGYTNPMFGTSGVIESLDVLLDWMEADPVDTWEMGRNDSTESITGTRNVFVDYPELAFIIFGQEVPANMQTPTNAAA